MRISVPMAITGISLLAIGAGTSDSGNFLLGAAIGFKGLTILFFSKELHRNPAWLKRQVKFIVWKYRPAWL